MVRTTIVVFTALLIAALPTAEQTNGMLLVGTGISGAGGGIISPTYFTSCINGAGFSTPTTCDLLNVTAGMVIYVFGAADQTGQPLTFVDICNTGGTSDSYTTGTQVTAGTSGVANYATAKVGVNTATCTVKVGFSGLSGSIAMHAIAISNPAATPIDVAGAIKYGNNPGTTVTSNSVTTTHNGDFVVSSTADVGVDGMTNAITINSPWTSRQNDNNYPSAAETQTQATAGAVNGTFTVGTANGQWLTSIVAFSSH